MKKIFLLLLFCCIIISSYSQGYRPMTIDVGRNTSSFSEVVKELNKQEMDKIQRIENTSNSAITAMEGKKYADAVILFEEVLNQIHQGGYGYEFGDVIPKITELRDYCKNKIENPNDNPYYKMDIGNILCFDYSLKPIYAYGKNNSISFIVFRTSDLESILIPDYQIFDFAKLLEDLNIEMTLLNNPSKTKHKPSDKFPARFSVLCTDIHHGIGFQQKMLKVGPMHSSKTNYYAAGISIDGHNIPIMLFDKEHQKYLSIFINNLYECESLYRNGQKEKVKDDDFYLNQLR